METTVQSLVTVTQHFMASQQHSLSPQVGRCGAWCAEGRSGGWGGGRGRCVCVGRGTAMETTVQSLVTVTQHFMTSQQHSLSPQVGRCGAWCVEGRSGGWGGGGGGVCVCGGARPWQPLCSCWSPSPNTSWPPSSTACLHRLVGVGLGVWRGNEVGKG